MKKTLILTLIVMLLFSLVGCMKGGNADEGQDGIIGNEEEADQDIVDDDVKDDMKDDWNDVKDSIDDKIDDILPDNGDDMLPDEDDFPDVENGIVSEDENDQDNATPDRNPVGRDRVNANNGQVPGEANRNGSGSTERNGKDGSVNGNENNGQRKRDVDNISGNVDNPADGNVLPGTIPPEAIR